MFCRSLCALSLARCCGVLLLAAAACSSDPEPVPERADGGPLDSSPPVGDSGPDSKRPRGVTFNAGGNLGERLRFTLSPQALTYSYIIEDSDFGLEGSSGSGTLIANRDGTYTPSGAPQARLIHLPQTLLIGAESIQLAGQPQLLLFAGTPARSVAYLPGEIAGLFNFVAYSCDKAADPNCGPQAYVTSHGTIEVAANGTFTLCAGGDLGDPRSSPCVSSLAGDWLDDGAGLISVQTPGPLVIGQGMLLPSSQGGKLLVLDLKNTPARGPGLLVAVERVSLAGAELAGAYHFIGEDGNHGLVEVDSGRDAYHGTRREPGQEPLFYQGTFHRDTPWPGWLAATDTTGGQSNVLVLPDVGAWINTSLAEGTNNWIDIGARLD